MVVTFAKFRAIASAVRVHPTAEIVLGFKRGPTLDCIVKVFAERGEQALEKGMHLVLYRESYQPPWLSEVGPAAFMPLQCCVTNLRSPTRLFCPAGRLMLQLFTLSVSNKFPSGETG